MVTKPLSKQIEENKKDTKEKNCNSQLLHRIKWLYISSFGNGKGYLPLNNYYYKYIEVSKLTVIKHKNRKAHNPVIALSVDTNLLCQIEWYQT